MTQSLPITYGIKDACEATGLSRSTIMRLIENGELKASKVGSRILIYTESILALLHEGESKI